MLSRISLPQPRTASKPLHGVSTFNVRRGNKQIFEQKQSELRICQLWIRPMCARRLFFRWRL